MHVTSTNSVLLYQDPVKKPYVRCETAELAKDVSRQINYAKSIYVERLLTLTNDNVTQFED